MSNLRPYQAKLRADILNAWAEGHRNVLAVLPTGGGKTRTFADIIHSHAGASCAIAHRQELVSQISMALNREGVRHRIIAPPKVIKACVRLHMEDTGRSFHDANARAGVAGVDTLIRRGAELAGWAASVTLWVSDENHHQLRENKWGKAAEMFPNAKGLGVTATPRRADGKGLGRHHDGIMDVLVEGPGMRDLIRMGYLVDYRLFAPPSDLDLSGVSLSDATGDYNRDQLAKAVHKSHIVGDVVEHYQRIAPGKRGITFAVDVATAQEIADRFNAAGVPAKMVSADTPDIERYHAVRDLAAGRLLQLVNVDLFGEGVDVPAVEVVSFARPTQSYSLYVQQFGRALRLLVDQSNWEALGDEGRRARIAQSGKPHAIIIDHVGNVVRHGLPDAPRAWSLDRREKRSSSKGRDPDVIPVRACPECTGVYERVYKECPYCGHEPKPAGRSAPEQVDGDLCELDPAVLARMRGEVDSVDMSLEDKRADLARRHVPIEGQMRGVKLHRLRQEAQSHLREAMAKWGQQWIGATDSEIQRRFFFAFGVDVLSAQALGTKEAEELTQLIGANNARL